MDYEYKAFLKALGARVKQLRRDKGWSLRDMIVLHGYHDTQWRKIERGEGIAIPSLLKVACLFDMTMSELLSGLCEVPSEPKAVAEKARTEVSKQPGAKRSRQVAS